MEDAAAIGSLKSMSRFGLIQRPNQNGGLSDGMGTAPAAYRSGGPDVKLGDVATRAMSGSPQRGQIEGS